MNFSIAATMRRLLAPRHELSCSWFLWRRLMAKLRERGRNCSRESGAFLLGHRHDGRRASSTSSSTTISIRTRSTPASSGSTAGIFGELWAICKARGLTVVADVHVHPGGAARATPIAITR